ncbi:MAG: DUF2510 domain-containing protein [Actinomycetota bacterium]|nr:DUF2510 domain-containing protein [Actinomycetota bacterium]
MSRSKGKRRRPSAAGWYQVQTKASDELTLRYFDGYMWTDRFRTAQYLSNTYEWHDVFGLVIEIDASNPSSVMRSNNYLNGLPSISSRRNKGGRRSRKALIFSLLLLAVLSSFSYVAAMFMHDSNRVVGPSSKTPLRADPKLIKAFSQVCITNITPQGPILATLASAGTNESKKLIYIRQLQMSLTKADAGMHSIIAPSSQAGNMAAWLSLWDDAASSAQLTRSDLEQGVMSQTTFDNLVNDLREINAISSSNAIDGCSTFKI